METLKATYERFILSQVLLKDFAVISELLLREVHLSVTTEIYSYFSEDCYNFSWQEYTKQ